MTEQENVIPETAPRMDVIHQIAKTLSERRATRSLSLEKVTQAIKIRMQYLQAIERGEWNDLPGEVYVRGFVRRYAQYLGLDGDKLLAPYLKLQELPVPQSSNHSPENSADGARFQWLWFVLAGIFLIGFIKVIKQETSVPVKSAAPVKTAAAPQEATPAKVETPKAADEKPVSLAQHEINVYSPFPLWLRVSATGKSFEGFIPQSSTWTWKAAGEFTLRLGHTKEVNLVFDGKHIPLGEDQKKVTLPL